MYPTILTNENIIVEAIEPSGVQVGDIILYKSNGNLIAHRVFEINMLTDKNSSPHSDLDSQSSVLNPHHFFTFRGDACPSCDDPVEANQILGKVVSIERNGHRINPYSFSHKISCHARSWVNRIIRLLNLSHVAKIKC
jgi:hypothetical protein